MAIDKKSGGTAHLGRAAADGVSVQAGDPLSSLIPGLLGPASSGLRSQLSPKANAVIDVISKTASVFGETKTDPSSLVNAALQDPKLKEAYALATSSAIGRDGTTTILLSPVFPDESLTSAMKPAEMGALEASTAALSATANLIPALGQLASALTSIGGSLLGQLYGAIMQRTWKSNASNWYHSCITELVKRGAVDPARTKVLDADKIMQFNSELAVYPPHVDRSRRESNSAALFTYAWTFLLNAVKAAALKDFIAGPLTKQAMLKEMPPEPGKTTPPPTVQIIQPNPPTVDQRPALVQAVTTLLTRLVAVSKGASPYEISTQADLDAWVAKQPADFRTKLQDVLSRTRYYDVTAILAADLRGKEASLYKTWKSLGGESIIGPLPPVSDNPAPVASEVPATENAGGPDDETDDLLLRTSLGSDRDTDEDDTAGETVGLTDLLR